ncbi:ABC transporter permease [Paramaledivibacter caminithermalis]|uniref:Glutathione transport system permease protein GsiC n=1 Tax=Paramaledivibacter caminithermalis (strain DSM 15212 / CIP 107654 / DViRD3) TaxID=1121301 RepID=A0A1M6NR16_PARC5|nr:ABC transporter permease subunit [Paramaledivibacter caminithermalis]SHJ98012.1 glutathione transport system permease protein [Paramaledivibacter caminithermalis DSM 15212]
MKQYVLKRLLNIIPIMIVVSIIIFMFIHLIPGDPARIIAGQKATLEEIEIMREQLGLNDPYIVQYKNFMLGILTGDWGNSLKTGLPVWEVIIPRMKPTLILAIFSIVWSVIAGISIGVISAINRGKLIDYIVMVGASSGISLPLFWLGLMLMQIFSVKLGWFPTTGIDSLSSYVLPSITLGAGITAMIARYTRSSMIEILKENYIRTSRAKGLSEFIVINKHALRNSLVDVITIVGLQFGFLLAGSVLVETVFAIPGLGRLLIDSILFRDYTVVQTVLLIFTFQFIIINLIVDVLYGVANPKIRYQ